MKVSPMEVSRWTCMMLAVACAAHLHSSGTNIRLGAVMTLQLPLLRLRPALPMVHMQPWWSRYEALATR